MHILLANLFTSRTKLQHTPCVQSGYIFFLLRRQHHLTKEETLGKTFSNTRGSSMAGLLTQFFFIPAASITEQNCPDQTGRVCCDVFPLLFTS